MTPASRANGVYMTPIHLTPATSLLVAWFQPSCVTSIRVFLKKGEQVYMNIELYQELRVAKVTRLLVVLGKTRA